MVCYNIYSSVSDFGDLVMEVWGLCGKIGLGMLIQSLGYVVEVWLKPFNMQSVNLSLVDNFKLGDDLKIVNEFVV